MSHNQWKSSPQLTHLKESSVTQSQEIISEWGTLVWNEAGTSTCQPEAAEEEPGTDDEIVDSDANDHENEHEGSKEDRDDEVEEEAPSKGTYQERSFWIVYCYLFLTSDSKLQVINCQDRKPLLPEPSVLAEAAQKSFEALASNVDTNEDLLKDSQWFKTCWGFTCLDLRNICFWISNSIWPHGSSNFFL